MRSWCHRSSVEGKLERVDQDVLQVFGALDQRTARILDRTGKPLPIDVPISEQDGRVVVELPMAAFARGEYALELTVGSGSIIERSPLAFRIQ